MASQKYSIVLNASSTAINIINDKNSVIYSISGAVNAYANPSAQLGKGFTYTISNANGTGSITTAGSGYTDGTYTGVWFSGGTGAGSRYTVVISGGVVTTVTKTSSSTTNYTVGDVLTISSLPYAYESIVLMSANTIPNQVGQQFSAPLNQINYINAVDVSAYTNVQMLNAIQDLASSAIPITVDIGGGALNDLDEMVTSLASLDGKVPSKGQATMANSSPVAIASDQSDLPVNLKATSSQTGALSIDSQIQTSAAVLTTVVKASAGRLGFISCFNSGSTPAYIKVYNKATTPSSSDTPIYRGVIPANNSVGAGFIQPIIIGVGMSAGISYRVTGAIADNDTTALTANTILVNVAYS